MATRSQVSTTAPQQTDTLVPSAVIRQSWQAESELEAEPLELSPQSSQAIQQSTFRENFSRVPVSDRGMPLVQPKLLVGQPNDKYEQEAERVANQVMQVPGSVASPLQGTAPNIQHYRPQLNQPVQRQLAESEMVPEEDDEKTVQSKALSSRPLVQHYFTGNQPQLQRQSQEGEEEEDDATPIQTKSTDAGQTTAAPRLETQLGNSQGGGSPLPKSTRTFMESRFSHDFSGVRVHSNSGAAQMNRGLNAQAFTHGHHIYFGQGQYQPHTRSGQRLLAHELTHVVQQTGDQRVQTKPLVQLQARTALIQARRAPEAPSVAAATVEEAPETAEETNAPTPEAVVPVEVEQPETEQPTATTEDAQAAVASEDAETTEAQTPAGADGAGTTSVELLMPEPPSELSEAAQERLHQAQNRAGQAAEVTTELPTAEANVGDARGAVEEPQEEAQARAENSLVEALGERPAPSPEIEELCKRIYKVIKSKRPPDEEALIEADPEEAAREAGNQLNQSIEGDVERVEGSYDQLEDPPEGTPQQQAEAIETPPEQVETRNIGAEEAVPDEVPAEDVSLDADVDASSARIEAAGLNTEPARLAAEGDPASPMAAAQSAQGELTETAQRSPAEVLAEQQEALSAASADMAALQENALAALMASRSNTVTGVGSQQTNMVGSEQQMRAQVGQQAQQIFSAAQQQVTTLLAPLQQNAMNKWEQGKTLLTTKFRQSLADVQRRVDEEYSGVIGSIVEFFAGLPDWAVEGYDRAEQEFGDGVCNLIREISTDVNTVVSACEQIIDNARQEINTLFDNLPQELQEWAAAEKERFGAQLDGLQNQVTQTRDNLNQDLANRAAQSVQEVREEIHALREAAKGLLSRIEDSVNEFLDDPAKFIIEGLLTVLGIAPSAFWAVVNKIEQAINDIADDPLGFAGNLLEAIGQGFQQFFDNFADHMLDGLLDWLFSGLGAVGVEIPTDFSLKSIITFFLQLMGISWERIRRLLAKHIGEKNVALIEKAYELIANLMEMGPEGVFEMIKDQLDPQSILDQIIQAAVDYLVEALIKAVSARIILLFNPVGAIVQAIEAIYKVLKWIFENAARIFSLIETVVNGIAKIIAGDIGGMATAVEGALAQLIAPVIDFLAGYLGFGDLPDKIADTIRGFQEWIEGILDRVIGFLADRAKSLLRSLGIGSEEEEANGEAEPGASNIFQKKTFTEEDGDEHSIQLRKESNNIYLVVESEPMRFAQLLQKRRSELGQESEEDAPKIQALNEAESLKNELDGLISKYAGNLEGKDSNVSVKESQKLGQSINDKLGELKSKLSIAGVEDNAVDLQPTNIIKKDKDSEGRAYHVLARPLTHLPGNTQGSAPRQDPIGWTDIPEENQNNWVRAHLLNHQLHGPGDSWNLVPGTKETNNNMKTDVENPAKDAVLNTSDPKHYFYEAKVTYFEGSHRPYYKYFPRIIEVRWGELIEKDGDFEEGNDKGRRFTQDPPIFSNVSAAAINESSSSRLHEASKGTEDEPTPDLAIPLGVFKIMVDVRRKLPGHTFQSREELVQLMNAEYKRPNHFGKNYASKLNALLDENIIFWNFP